MANLPNLANRLNDIEISANAPLTETLMRRIGSNINLLLDFLGIPNGSSSASGTLADFINAVSTIEGHTIAKQGAFPGNVTSLVGTYSRIKFVNRVFWARAEEASLSQNAVPRALLKSIDGGPNVQFSANRVTPTNISTFAASIDALDLNSQNLTDDPFVNTSSEAYKRFFDAAVGTIGYESPMRKSEWQKVGVLHWRDFPAVSSTAEVRSYHEPGSAVFHCWMSYELDLQSAPLVGS